MIMSHTQLKTHDCLKNKQTEEYMQQFLSQLVLGLNKSIWLNIAVILYFTGQQAI